MSSLSGLEKLLLEKLFQMNEGYLLDFSNRTFEKFFMENLSVDIYSDVYSDYGTSKANIVRCFRLKEENELVGKSILKLVEYIENKVAIGEFTNISDKLIFKANEIGNNLIKKQLKDSQVHIDKKISDMVILFVKKAESEIELEDFAGAIGTTWTFMEEFFDEIHINLTGESIGKNADLTKDYYKIRSLLNLVPNKNINDKINQLLDGFSKIIDSMDKLCNSMGDRHKKLKDDDFNVIKTLKHHAILVLNSAKTISQFLVDTYEYQKIRKVGLEDELLEILDSDITKTSKTISSDKWKTRLSNQPFSYISNYVFVKKWLKKSDAYINKYLIKKYIETFHINTRDKNSKFFSLMTVLYDRLNIEDVTSIYEKWKLSKNDQAFGLKSFINGLIDNKPIIVEDYIREDIDILNVSEKNTHSEVFDDLARQFYFGKDKYGSLAETLKRKTGDKKELLKKFVYRNFSGIKVGEFDYTKEILDFLEE